jgi:transposase
LKPTPLGAIPADTYKLGQELLGAEDLFRCVGEQYAEMVKDEDFEQMYSHTGQPALSPARLVLISVLQAMEHLSDRQAMAMVRTQIY